MAMFARRHCCVLLLLGLFLGSAVQAESDLQREVDSLFVIASSGELKYRDLVQPAIDSIAALGSPAVPLLVDKFTTKSARERWTIIWILEKIGSDAVPHLVTSLARPEGLVVSRVCWALGSIKDTAAVEPLIGVSDHARWQVRDQAMEALGKIGDNRADDVVMQSLNDPVGQIRKSGAVSCGRLGINEAIPALIGRLGDEFYGARLEAAEALQKLDTSLVVEALADSLETADNLSGNLIASVLGSLGTTDALELLVSEALTATSAARRGHAAVALVKADPQDNCGYLNQILLSEPDRLTRLKVESAIASARHESEQVSE